MGKELFYDEYQEFYKMTAKSQAFGKFCKAAFGMDFSQDGFSDIQQINRIIEYIPRTGSASILDIGCGNGKMLGYLQSCVPSKIFGFDYSKSAIDFAKEMFPKASEFKTAAIGGIEYPKNSFDLIISMDTMYFADDMNSFVAQIKEWLKPEGVFFAGYQEGDVVSKTENAHTTLLANALKSNNMTHSVENITKESYDVLKRKKDAALSFKDDFIKEGNEKWYDMLIGQTAYADVSFEIFQRKMSRYIYVAMKKNGYEIWKEIS